MKVQGNFCTIFETMATTELGIEIIALSSQGFNCVLISVDCESEFCKVRRSFKFFMQRSKKFDFQRLQYFEVGLLEEGR